MMQCQNINTDIFIFLYKYGFICYTNLTPVTLLRRPVKRQKSSVEFKTDLNILDPKPSTLNPKP